MDCMQAITRQGEKLSFFDCTAESLAAQFETWGWPAYRARQVLQWVYGRLVADATKMTNLSLPDRRILAERVALGTAQVQAAQASADGTLKLLLGWPDGSLAETVMIPEGDRFTACVSSQVGCPVGCRFCASGLDGLQGNLTAGQIVEQVFALNVELAKRGGRITHVVFMGMGEPLANYAAVMAAVRTMHDPRAMGLGARRFTISTVGVPSRIRDLAGEGLPLNLAISLHAPDEALRRELIPWARHFPLGEVMDAARHYFQVTGREVTLEYILLAGVNDRPEHARKLAELCRGLRANVNLIRYNPVPGLAFRRPAAAEAQRFQRALRERGINAHLRRSRGQDIDAACGQLRRRQQAVAPAVVTVGASAAPGPGGS